MLVILQLWKLVIIRAGDFPGDEMAKAKVWIKEKEFAGSPAKEDFKLVEEDLPELKDGGECNVMTVFPFVL